MRLAENAHPVVALTPQAISGALTGDYISMKKVDHITIAVMLAQGHATPPALSIYQATAVAGTGAKVIANAVDIYTVLDAAATDLMVKQTSAVNYTPDAGVKNKIILFEVPVEKLDVNNNFDCLQLRVGASNALNIISAVYWCTGERYHNTTKIAD